MFNPVNKLITTKTFLNNMLRKQKKNTLVYPKVITKISLKFISDVDNKNAKYTYLPRNLINVNFLRKERLYTKLKYSRSPAYDIVSGGAAALLAGFIGFLISEKYGFELVDSGDFYYLFMYLVFLGFSLRPLLTSIDHNESITSVFSLKKFTTFYLNLIYYLLGK
jgi:hypothetical protein